MFYRSIQIWFTAGIFNYNGYESGAAAGSARDWPTKKNSPGSRRGCNELPRTSCSERAEFSKSLGGQVVESDTLLVPVAGHGFADFGDFLVALGCV